MIPKIIHYCWISGEENMPEDIKACVESWHKYLPDYEFINWNDKNFDWNICEFTKHCRENNLYAFCSDYVRFWALYNYGGIYLDCDVMVYKSFDELLKLKRIITKELLFQFRLEAAILGCEKHDSLFSDVVNWYNNRKDKWDDCNFITAPDVMKEVFIKHFDLAKKNFNVNEIKDINHDSDSYDALSIIDVNQYFNHESENSFCEHKFKGSWLGFTTDDCMKNDKVKIFLCAHKPIDNYIPKSKKYVILDVTGKVNDEYNDNYHEIIDISNDDFVKTHNVCYSEGAAIRWLYNHQDMIPEYICLGHYRRMFVEFVGKEAFIPRYVDKYGAIINVPVGFTGGIRINNKAVARHDHPRDEFNVFVECVKDVAPEYLDMFNEFMKSKTYYCCNCFAMKKEDFLDMCEFCFRVLDHFDKKQGYKNNEDVLNKMFALSLEKKLNIDKVGWQSRLQGFFLEYLTDTFYRKRFGVDNCYKSPLKTPTQRVLLIF